MSEGANRVLDEMLGVIRLINAVRVVSMRSARQPQVLEKRICNSRDKRRSHLPRLIHRAFDGTRNPVQIPPRRASLLHKGSSRYSQPGTGREKQSANIAA